MSAPINAQTPTFELSEGPSVHSGQRGVPAPTVLTCASPGPAATQGDRARTLGGRPHTCRRSMGVEHVHLLTCRCRKSASRGAVAVESPWSREPPAPGAWPHCAHHPAPVRLREHRSPRGSLRCPCYDKHERLLCSYGMKAPGLHLPDTQAPSNPCRTPPGPPRGRQRPHGAALRLPAGLRLRGQRLHGGLSQLAGLIQFGGPGLRLPERLGAALQEAGGHVRGR